MKKTISALAASFTMVLCCCGLALAEKAAFVQQEDAPLKVLAYGTKFGTKADKPRVVHEVKYQNRSKSEVVAARFGILEYNGYNEKIDSFIGYTLEGSSAGEKDSAEFVNEEPHAIFFEDFGAGYLWVDAVRFADGTIWKANRTLLLEDMKRLNSEITGVDLTEKKSLPAD
ncbi:MAG: hypothetical protein A2075_23485 [Geobacteraceae bacterium GWC2_58_44]|nr:MAG: hypothetical protein A2075_23485 [Geobacteraceae bacterium GWC2_58_44]HBG07593.1 hypothetical protein [Geobacter sp.]